MSTDFTPPSSRVQPPILRWFGVDHLKPGLPRDVSAAVGKLAHALVEVLPDGPERATALRKLLEARDAAVRAAIEAAS